MSPRARRQLLRVYPPTWRARYGEEMDALLVSCAAGGRTPARTYLDLLRGGLGERVRSWGLDRDGGAPAEQARAWVLVVLCAWTPFVVAGIGLQKISEHWQSLTPPASRGLPTDAFEGLVLAAVLGAGAVVTGLLVAVPRLAVLLRSGAARDLQPALMRAIGLSVLAVTVGAGIIFWARHLDSAQRNGADGAYGLAFAGWVSLAVLSLIAWTGFVVKAARRIGLTTGMLALEARLAAAAAAAMVTATVAAAVWCTALANDAPWVLEGRAHSSAATPFPLQLLTEVVIMALASVLALMASWRAARALSRLRELEQIPR